MPTTFGLTLSVDILLWMVFEHVPSGQISTKIHSTWTGNKHVIFVLRGNSYVVKLHYPGWRVTGCLLFCMPCASRFIKSKFAVCSQAGPLGPPRQVQRELSDVIALEQKVPSEAFLGSCFGDALVFLRNRANCYFWPLPSMVPRSVRTPFLKILNILPGPTGALGVFGSKFFPNLCSARFSCCSLPVSLASASA